MKLLHATVVFLVLGVSAGTALAQQGNSAGDASNAQQNGENTQTKTGGQPGGGTDRQ